MPTLPHEFTGILTAFAAHFGEVRRQIEFTTGTAVWYHVSKPAVPLRWLIVRAPLGRFKTQALACTDLNALTPCAIRPDGQSPDKVESTCT